MAAAQKKKASKQAPKQQDITKQVFSTLSVIGAIVLVGVGILALWAHNFTTSMVHNELAAQKIYFPEKGSAGFDAETYPDLQQYAGQLLDTPEKAKAYANGYIGRHLEKIAGGKVYAEVSTAAKLDPTNEKLAAQKESLFQGETLRGMLLTSGYGFGTVGKIAGIAAVVSFIGALGLFCTGFVLRK